AVVYLDATVHGHEVRRHRISVLGEGYLRSVVEIAERLAVGQSAQDPLADVEAEKLGEEAAPGRLASAGSRLSNDLTVVVSDLDYGPSSPPEQEAAHAVDETVHESLIQRAERLSGRRL